MWVEGSLNQGLNQGITDNYSLDRDNQIASTSTENVLGLILLSYLTFVLTPYFGSSNVSVAYVEISPRNLRFYRVVKRSNIMCRSRKAWLEDPGRNLGFTVSTCVSEDYRII